MKISLYLDQTEKYIIPMAEEINSDFVKEIADLVIKRRLH